MADKNSREEEELIRALFIIIMITSQRSVEILTERDMSSVYLAKRKVKCRVIVIKPGKHRQTVLSTKECFIRLCLECRA
ncbi:hypothetical protein BG55_01960 [Erwinia mallotivora]|uniref:Uncharacterized protein n=1 Tax=Erwinia mallotivora TaxID=69222 RepID=A0A014MGH3_9GAMM|nr:hypothetical protein BG55_01960 [Erwinia mallotivora]